MNDIGSLFEHERRIIPSRAGAFEQNDHAPLIVGKPDPIAGIGTGLHVNRHERRNEVCRFKKLLSHN